MVANWTAWKSFPDPRQGGQLEAPIGPGIYEVRDNSNGAMIAFGSSGSVARELARLHPAAPRGIFASLFGEPQPQVDLDNLEYRTWAAGSLAEARGNADRLRGRREVYMRRRNHAWA